MDASKFLTYISEHYSELKDRFKAFCVDKKYTYDDDIFSETILRCYEKIKKDPLRDDSPGGIENYFFKAFKRNLSREKQYARNKKRDNNITDETLHKVYETYSNDSKIPLPEKLLSDLRKDYYSLYILNAVQQHFDDEHFYLFRLKFFDKLTYRQLAEKTNIKASRQKVIDVKHWLHENVKIDDIKKAFEQDYDIFL